MDSGFDTGTADVAIIDSGSEATPESGLQLFHCAPGQGLETEAGPEQGTLGCSTSDGGVVQLLSNFTGWPQRMAVDDSNLYWAEADGIVKADKGAMPIAKFCVPWGSIQAFLDDGASLYAAVVDPASQSHSILVIPTAGGDWSELVKLTAWPTRLAVDATSVYWLEQDMPPPPNPYGASRIGQVNKDGSGAQIIVSGEDIQSMLSDGSSLYWVTSIYMGRGGYDTVMARQLAGSQSTGVVAQTRDYGWPTGFALSRTNVFWVGDPPTGAAIWSVDKGGFSLNELATNSNANVPFGGLVVDGAVVYWGEDAFGPDPGGGTFRIYKANTANGTLQVILAKRTAYLGTPNGALNESALDLATDVVALYFTTTLIAPTPGNLYKICK